MDILIKVYAYLATIPFIPFILIYYICYLCKKTKKESFNIASYITSILLISVVAGQLNLLFTIKTGYLIALLIVIFISMGLFFLQKNIKGRIDVYKLVTSTLRLSFVLFSILYIIFLLILILF